MAKLILQCCCVTSPLVLHNTTARPRIAARPAKLAATTPLEPGAPAVIVDDVGPVDSAPAATLLATELLAPVASAVNTPFVPVMTPLSLPPVVLAARPVAPDSLPPASLVILSALPTAVARPPYPLYVCK